MTYTPTEKDQLVKYAKTAICLFTSEIGVPDNKHIAKICFDLAEAMIDEQRRRFGS